MYIYAALCKATVERMASIAIVIFARSRAVRALAASGRRCMQAGRNAMWAAHSDEEDLQHDDYDYDDGNLGGRDYTVERARTRMPTTCLMTTVTMFKPRTMVGALLATVAKRSRVK